MTRIRTSLLIAEGTRDALGSALRDAERTEDRAKEIAKKREEKDAEDRAKALEAARTGIDAAEVKRRSEEIRNKGF